MTLELHVDSETAEEILFALKLRACQRGAPEDTPARMERVRQQLNAQFEKAFGWTQKADRSAAAENNIRVTVTTRNRW